MRRLLLSSKRIPFSAGPPGSRHCHSHPILLPPHFHSHSRRLAPARFRLDSVVRALPSFSRSQSPIGSLSTDRIVGGTQSLGRGGLENSILAALLTGLYPQATWVLSSSPHVTLHRPLDQLTQFALWQLVRLLAFRQLDHAN